MKGLNLSRDINVNFAQRIQDFLDRKLLDLSERKNPTFEFDYSVTPWTNDTTIVSVHIIERKSGCPNVAIFAIPNLKLQSSEVKIRAWMSGEGVCWI